MSTRFFSVFKKEVLDALRDRKALATILIMPIFNLLVIYGIVHFFVYMQKSGQDFILPVQGSEYAVPIVEWLEENGINVVEASDTAIDKVKNNQLDFVLVIPENFPEQFDALEPAIIELVYDRSRKDIATKVMTIKTSLQRWSSSVGALRLLTRGVSPEIMRPLNVQDSDVSKDKAGSSMIFGVIALILTLTVFTTTMGISIDMMAGEREKNSLEPLLLSPASRWSIFLGKWATAMAFTLVIIVFVSLAFYLLLPQLPLAQLGVRNSLSFFDISVVVLISVPLAMISTAFQLFVSIFSRSYKEAQSYIGMLMIVPVMVGYYVIWSDVSPEWQYYVPVMGAQMLMEDVLGVGWSAWQHYAACFGISLLLSWLLAVVTVRQLQREKIIYG